MEFAFHSLDSVKNLALLVGFIRLQDLNYPDYQAWVDRSKVELEAEYKKAILAWSSEHGQRTLVGNIIYQPHKSLSGFMEAKNLRVHPEFRRRDFAHFMLRQVEEESLREGYCVIISDARSSQKDMLRFLRFAGYQELARAPLYDSNQEEVVMAKPIGRDTKAIIVAKNFFN